MQEILSEYQLNPTTWAYLSALLTVGIFFKFHRFWSVRNSDLLGLIVLSPGILFIFHGTLSGRADRVQDGYIWLFVVGAFFLVRLLLDTIMVRRPLLEPNLNASGLTFTGVAILVFLSANLLATNPSDRLEHVLAKKEGTAIRSPGYVVFYYLASFSNAPAAPADKTHWLWPYPSPNVERSVARGVALAGLLALVLGIVVIGYRHFENIQWGVAAASLYLLLPYAGQMTGRIDHVVPAAMLVWAVAAYRRPLIAGLLIGLAAGLIFYPLFLLPLWCSFYLRRGLGRFLGGVLFSLVVLVLLLPLLSDNLQALAGQLRQMFGGTLFSEEKAAGFWEDYQWWFRIPMVALFVVLSASLGPWPAHKNLGTLVSCTAAVMLAAQFIKVYEGGLYMAWYLPLLVLTIFRPNLDDRIAVSAVIEGRTTWPVRLASRWRKGV